MCCLYWRSADHHLIKLLVCTLGKKVSKADAMPLLDERLELRHGQMVRVVDKALKKAPPHLSRAWREHHREKIEIGVGAVQLVHVEIWHPAPSARCIRKREGRGGPVRMSGVSAAKPEPRPKVYLCSRRHRDNVRP